MSLFEWIGERRNPGPLGTIEHETPDPGHWNPRIIVARGVIAAIMLAASIALVVSERGLDRKAGFILIALGVYGTIGYWVSPRPNYQNVGFLGGLIDHPFRWSDDYNRTLGVLRILLWPGRFVSVSLRDLLRLSRGKRTIVLPQRDD